MRIKGKGASEICKVKRFGGAPVRFIDFSFEADVIIIFNIILYRNWNENVLTLICICPKYIDRYFNKLG